MKIFPKKIGPAKFFGLHLLSMIAGIGSGVCGSILLGAYPWGPLGTILALQLIAFAALCILYNFCVVWPARLHDCNWSPMLQVLRFVPVASFGLFIALLVQKGKPQ